MHTDEEKAIKVVNLTSHPLTFSFSEGENAPADFVVGVDETVNIEWDIYTKDYFGAQIQYKRPIITDAVLDIIAKYIGMAYNDRKYLYLIYVSLPTLQALKMSGAPLHEDNWVIGVVESATPRGSKRKIAKAYVISTM